MAQEMNEAAGKVMLREASRPAITYPDNLPVSQKKQAILEAVRDNQVVIVAVKPAPGKPPSYQKSVWNWGVG
jgi:ATP-dependent helicase HrpA